MALTELQRKKIEAEERDRLPLVAYTDIQQINQRHGVPALLSFLIPGLGQIVKGQVGKGILIFIGIPIGFMFLIIPGIFIWIWQIIDAYND